MCLQPLSPHCIYLLPLGSARVGSIAKDGWGQGKKKVPEYTLRSLITVPVPKINPSPYPVVKTPPSELLETCFRAWSGGWGKSRVEQKQNKKKCGVTPAFHFIIVPVPKINYSPTPVVKAPPFVLLETRCSAWSGGKSRLEQLVEKQQHTMQSLEVQYVLFFSSALFFFFFSIVFCFRACTANSTHHDAHLGGVYC